MERRKKVDRGTRNILAALPLKSTGNSHGIEDANEMNLKSKTPKHQQQTTEISKMGGPNSVKVSVSLKVNYSFNTIPIKISAGNFVN